MYKWFQLRIRACLDAICLRTSHSGRILLILCLALCVRIGFHLLYPDIFHRDSYHEVAVRFLDTGTIEWRGQPSAYFAPFLPVMLAQVYRIAGVSEEYGIYYLVVLGALTCGLIADMGQRLYGARASLIAGSLSALYPGFFTWTNVVMTEIQFLFFVILACWFLVLELKTENRAFLYGAGISLGLAFLTRAVLVLFPPFLLMWALLRYRNDYQTALLRWLNLVLPMILIMGMWAVRNYFMLGGVVLATTAGCENLIYTNNSETYSSWNTAGSFIGFLPKEMFPASEGYIGENRYPSRKWYALSEVERMRIIQSRSMNWILAHPFAFVKSIPWKWARVWGLAFRRLIWPLWVSLLNSGIYYLILLPAVWYAIREQTCWRAHGFWVAMALYVTLLHAFFDGDMRYRIAVEPGMILLGSLWLEKLIGSDEEPERRTLFAG